MIDKLETCRDHGATIPLSFLEILYLYIVPTRFYEYWMCDTFSQIQSHMSLSEVSRIYMYNKPRA